MKRTTLFRSVMGALAAALVAVSCGVDRTVTAPPQPQAGLVGNLLGSLLVCEPLPFDADSALIGPAGGQLTMGPHTLTIPRGALSRTMMIKGEAPSDSVASVRFAPEGLRFAKSATLTMSYANCSLVAGLLRSKQIAYTTDGLLILSWIPSLDNPLTQRVTGRLDHFSRYAVGW